MENLKNIAKSIIEKTDLESEIFIIETKSSFVEVRNQKVEKIKSGVVLGLGLRIFNKNKLGFAFSNDINNIDELLTKAISNLQNSKECNFYGFAKKFTPKNILNIPYDKKIAQLTKDNKINLAKEIENAAFSYDKRIVNCESANYFDEETTIFLQTSNGFSSGYKKIYCGGSMQAISQENNLFEEGHYVKQFVDLDLFNAKEIGQNAAKKAIEMLGAKIIKSGEMPVVLSNFVASQFLYAASSMFFGDNVYKKKSLFFDKLGSKIASSKINILEDALKEEGIASRPFDDEGIESQKLYVVRNGILENFLYNIEAASQAKKSSTSSATRNSYRTPPVIGTTNFYIDNGHVSENGIIDMVDKGLYVTNVMALHSLNPISGDFSLGASGFMIENGKKIFPVRGVTIAGNLANLLFNVVETGNNLEFFTESNNCGSPTLLIKNLSIAGE